MIALALIVGCLLGLELGFSLARRQLLRAVAAISRTAEEQLAARQAVVDTMMRETERILQDAQAELGKMSERQALLDTLRGATPPRAN